MKFKVNAGLISIIDLTPSEFDVMLGIVEAADRQCFDDRIEEADLYCSGDGLTLSISSEQRAALSTLGKRIRDIYNS